MSRKVISYETKQSIIQDWKYGKFKSYRRIGMEYELSAPAAKRIIEESKAVWGCEAEEYQKIKDEHVEATRAYAENPTYENEKRLIEIRDALPRGSSLFNLIEIVEESNSIVAKDMIEAIEEELVRSNLVHLNVRVNDKLRSNRKEVLLRDGEKIMTELDTQDLKNLASVVSKSMDALGLGAINKSDSNIVVDVQVQQQNQPKASLSDFYRDMENE